MKRKIGEIITIQDDDDFIDIKKCFINNLPNEILLIIFDFLDSIELSKFLIVCKLWKKVINNTNLMKISYFLKKYLIRRVEMAWGSRGEIPVEGCEKWDIGKFRELCRTRYVAE